MRPGVEPLEVIEEFKNEEAAESCAADVQAGGDPRSPSGADH
jgi:hypothetical protein